MNALRFFPLLLAVFWFCLKIPLLRPFHFDGDGATITLGTYQYNLWAHMPVPPGYPLWTAATRQMREAGLNAAIGQTLLSWAFGAAALYVFYRLLRRETRPATAVCFTACLAFAPLVMQLTSQTGTYAADLFVSAFLACAAVEARAGEAGWAFLLLPVLALTMGFRPSGGGFLAPWAVWIAMGLARRWPVWMAVSAIAAIAVYFGWYAPMAATVGGLGPMRALIDGQTAASLRETSIFFGAPLGQSLVMWEQVVVWLGLGAAGAACFGLLLPRARRAATPQRAARLTWMDVLLWMGPAGVFVTLAHSTKPGHLVVLLPPLVYLAARCFDGRVAAAGEDQLAPRLAAVVGLSVVLGFFPWQDWVNPYSTHWRYMFQRTTPAYAMFVLDNQEVLGRLLAARADAPGAVMIVETVPSHNPPGSRTALADFPRAAGARVVANTLQVEGRSWVKVTPEVPAEVRWLWWLMPANGPPPTSGAGLKEPRRLSRIGPVAVWETELEPGPWQTTVRYPGAAVPLQRSGAASSQ
jgi:hypothetical protein